MADEKLRRLENAPGDFFVDRTCIDCDTCRWLAPRIFRRAGDKSAVFRQPSDSAERLAALQALLACPTASIGFRGSKQELYEAARTFPLLIEDNVYYCGFSSPHSYGAASYFIQRPSGNVMVDCPRIHGGLAKRIQEMGGIRWMVLTHRDNVADHQEWTDRFGCERVMHQADLEASTREVEIQIFGEAPQALDRDLTLIPTPGHTPGHVVLLFSGKFLFTGDHLEYDEEAGALRAFRDYCWYDWKQQIASTRRLLDYDFEWVLPGHGRRGHADKATMRRWLEACIDWMEKA